MHSRSLKFVGLGATVLLLLSSSLTLAGELDWLDVVPNNAATSASDDISPQRLPIRKVGGALAVVLGGFLLLTVLLRKQAPAIAANDMMEPLGSVQIAPKVRLHLVRFGSRILVLHISGQNVQRVAELDDAKEVERLLRGYPDRQAASLPVSVNDLLQTVDPRATAPAQGRIL